MVNPPLPTRVRHGYGLGALSIALVNTSVLFFLAKFLVDEVGLQPGVAGLVVFLGKAWDAVSDPLIGRFVDRTRSGMGARRPWIAVGMWPFALLFAMLWMDLGSSGWTAAAGYAALLILYNTAYTAVVVPYGALTPALTDDYDERTRLNAARMGWSMIGGIIAAVLMPLLREQTGTYATGGLVLAALTIPPLLASLVVTRGRDPSGDLRGSVPMWSVLANRPFRRVVFLFVCAWSSIAVLAALIPFYLEHRLRRPDLEDVMLASIQLSALASIPLVVLLSRRLEKHVAYACAMLAWAVVMVALGALPPGAWQGALGLALLVGPGVAGAHVLPWAMLPDVVEADRAEHGVERPGAFYGVMTFFEKGATAVALQALLIGLQVAGYEPGAATQPDRAVFGIVVLIGPVPAVILGVAAVAALWFPPLTRAQHHALTGRASGEARDEQIEQA